MAVKTISLWQRLLGKHDPDVSRRGSGEPVSPASRVTADVREAKPAASPSNRRIRVFISSTFRDMIEERDMLMTHTWPELRRRFRERRVELVEVDLRWGISESQRTRRETLKLCLDEIRSCRPYFIGLLGERYGSVPGDDKFTTDLREEQPWIAGHRDKSMTELEILHGVLNNPDMASRAYFYFRDPDYAQGRGPDFLSESDGDAEKQTILKSKIRTVCAAKSIPVRENYSDPGELAALVLDDLSAAIEAQFPIENTPDALAREAQDHEAFAEIRRRTYVGRVEYFEALDGHAADDNGPLLLLGDSGSGKSALLANWLAHWRKGHPEDFIFQHYIGSTVDSANHWRLMSRVMAEIKAWTGDPEIPPTRHEDMLKDFPHWLTKARRWAAREGLRFILVLDALDQLGDRDHARLLSWLPEHPFSGPLRLIVSTLPGTSSADDPLEAIHNRRWQKLRVQPLTVDERERMIVGYLARFGKTLDGDRLVRLVSAAAAANPLYLKILLDDIRVTGTFERLDQRLTEYLAAPDIPTLLQQVLARYQRDYERDRPGLVADALGLIYAARRGLSETELLQLLRSRNQQQLPPALWMPLRAALEESLVDRGGILNFAHDFLHTAVGNAFASDQERRNKLRLQLADYFEAQPITARSCDELPWLLRETGSLARLQACLLHIDRFLLIQARDEDELRRYWVEPLQGQQEMGNAYLASFESWSRKQKPPESRIAYVANQLGTFLHNAVLPEAEPLMRRALESVDRGSNNQPYVADLLSNLAMLLLNTNRPAEAELLMRRAIGIDQLNLGSDHSNLAIHLNNLAQVLKETNRLAEAEPLMRRALEIDERNFGKDHPDVARDLINLAQVLQETNRLAEAEPLMRRALDIDERILGKDHPNVARDLIDIAALLQAASRFTEAEPLLRRGLDIDERNFGKDHPGVATCLNNLARLLQDTNRPAEAEPLLRRALAIDEHSYGKDHPKVATCLNSLAMLLEDTDRVAEAEPLLRRALDIDERNLGKDHPKVAIRLNNLAWLLRDTNRLAEAEPLLRRGLKIHVKFALATGHPHPHLGYVVDNYGRLLQAMGHTNEEILATLRSVAPEMKGFFVNAKPG